VEDLSELPLEETTIAEALREGGYQTFTRGKWHLGDRGPEQHGFTAPLKAAPSRNPARDAGTVEDCLQFLEEARNDPFFLYLAFTYPHTPVNGVPPHVERFRAKLARMNYPEPRLAKERSGNTRLHQDNPEYASMLYAMDELAGRVFAKLDDLKLSDNTVVVFTSDNGGLSTAEGSPTSNLPLRAGKGWNYEGGLRVPLIVRLPGRVAAGTTCDVPVISNDLYPTFLAWAGLPAPAEQRPDGVSLVPLLERKGTLAERPLFWHYPHYSNQGGRPGGAVRLGNWKLLEFFEDNHVELYDLAADSGENTDLAKAQPAQAEQLQKQLAAWRRSVDAQMPTPNPEPVEPFGPQGRPKPVTKKPKRN
jgi:arylsulfatase A-like enzyme